MKNWRPLLLLRSPARRGGIALLTLAAFLWLLALSTSAALHHEEHHDADAAHHECAVTLLAHGKLDAAPSLALALAPPARPRPPSFPPLTVLARVDHRLMPGRAPPAFH